MKRVLVGVLAVAAIAGCGKESEPAAGTLLISLITPSVDDGAIRLMVFGGRIGAVTAADPADRIFVSRPDSNTARVIVTGALEAGPLLRIEVPDVELVASYGVTVQEAAARTTYESRALVGYAATIAGE